MKKIELKKKENGSNSVSVTMHTHILNTYESFCEIVVNNHQN